MKCSSKEIFLVTFVHEGYKQLKQTVASESGRMLYYWLPVDYSDYFSFLHDCKIRMSLKSLTQEQTVGLLG